MFFKDAREREEANFHFLHIKDVILVDQQKKSDAIVSQFLKMQNVVQGPAREGKETPKQGIKKQMIKLKNCGS